MRCCAEGCTATADPTLAPIELCAHHHRAFVEGARRANTAYRRGDLVQEFVPSTDWLDAVEEQNARPTPAEGLAWPGIDHSETGHTCQRIGPAPGLDDGERCIADAREPGGTGKFCRDHA